MAKYIKISPEHFDEIKRSFEEMLATGKFADGKVSFSRTIGTVKRSAQIYFTEVAWLKMQTLIREFDKEVAWHGVAYRGEDETKDEYIISDILVYPQEVTGVTVNTDQEKYQNWLMGQEDEVFNNIRMQGHSHVNMSTSPSATDTDHQEKILAQLDDTMFYIFLIYNKRGEKTVKIYDLAKNILFETADVTVSVIESELGMERFVRESKEMVKDKVYSNVNKSTGGYQKNIYGNGYYDDDDYYYRGYGSESLYSNVYSNTKKTDSKILDNKPTEVLPKGKGKKGKRKRG